MLSDDQSLRIFSDIVLKLEATASANQIMSRTLSEVKTAIFDLSKDQRTLHESSEAILLAAQRAEERAARAEDSWQKAESKIDRFSNDVSQNNKAFIQSISQFNQMQVEWKARSEGWEYRIKLLEEDALPKLHEMVEIAVTEVRRDINALKSDVERRYLSKEEYKDDLQDGTIAAGQKKIQEYEGFFEQAKSFLKRGGGWAWGLIGAIVILVKDQVPWGELWDWFVDTFL